jgi:hypothetical protein
MRLLLEAPDGEIEFLVQLVQVPASDALGRAGS